MEIQRDRPPEYFASHSPQDLRLPLVPVHDLDQHRSRESLKLPDLKTILSPEYEHLPQGQDGFGTFDSSGLVRVLPRIDPGPTKSESTRRSADLITFNTSGRTSTEERVGRSTSVVSMDDPDVRIAAEALSGLGNPEFSKSPQKAPSHEHSHARGSQASHASPNADEAEPLLELLAQAHPWVGGTINQSLSAYSTTKYYSPRLVQAGANLVERNITTPIASTVGTVSRMTGVESGLRRYLRSSRRPGDMQAGTASGTKRPWPTEDDMDVENGLISPRSCLRRDSQESRLEYLPPYRASKPPSYHEEESPAPSDRAQQGDRPAHNRSWSSQVIVMTSGLGVALSDRSRDSLSYCLTFLGRASDQIALITRALKIVLQQYDQAREHWHRRHDSSMEKGERPSTPDHDEAAKHLAEVMKQHSDDIWQTLKSVVNYVSNTAGGALPDNARHFVRNQLMSLPQRWRVVSDGQMGDSETSRSAHRMIAFATEGLDMIAQVSSACRATLDSADLWLQRVGRRRAVESRPNGHHDPEQDQVMADADDAHHLQTGEKQ